MGRSVTFSPFYADFCLCPKISDYHHLKGNHVMVFIISDDMVCTDDTSCAGLAESECKDDAGTKKCKCKSGYKHVAPECVADSK